MPDLSQYNLSDSFRGAVSYPKVGETIRGKLILAVWVNKYNSLIGYKIKCGKCSKISEFVNAGKLKTRALDTCQYCFQAQPSTIWFKQNYDEKTAKKLRSLYGKKGKERTGPKLYESWETDYKAFAEYITSLPNFDKWPKYQLDRIDNDNMCYEPGNIRFVTPRDNTNNRSITKFVEFKRTKYPLADFIRLIVGKDCIEIYSFIKTRIFIRPRPLNQALKELKDSNRFSIWPSKEMRQYYLNWYNTNIINEDL